jgi:hypothetical protein
MYWHYFIQGFLLVEWNIFEQIVGGFSDRTPHEIISFHSELTPKLSSFLNQMDAPFLPTPEVPQK